MALDDLITTFEQDGYRFVQLVPPPGAQPPGDLKAAGPIFGSSAAAGSRDLAGDPASKGLPLRDKVLAVMRDWAARITVFGHWLGGELGHLWREGLALLRH